MITLIFENETVRVAEQSEAERICRQQKVGKSAIRKETAETWKIAKKFTVFGQKAVKDFDPDAKVR